MFRILKRKVEHKQKSRDNCQNSKSLKSTKFFTVIQFYNQVNNQIKSVAKNGDEEQIICWPLTQEKYDIEVVERKCHQPEGWRL